MSAASAAHGAVAYAIKTGRLERLPCEVCGHPVAEGHHDDYSKRLDVRWLCRMHHRWLHLYGLSIEHMCERWNRRGAA